MKFNTPPAQQRRSNCCVCADVSSDVISPFRVTTSQHSGPCGQFDNQSSLSDTYALLFHGLMNRHSECIKHYKDQFGVLCCVMVQCGVKCCVVLCKKRRSKSMSVLKRLREEIQSNQCLLSHLNIMKT